jgi:2-polyprenyl-3-methyl-5-hydroxy-6-metoxy-1,4-benzoquinol methylase
MSDTAALPRMMRRWTRWVRRLGLSSPARATEPAAARPSAAPDAAKGFFRTLERHSHAPALRVDVEADRDSLERLAARVTASWAAMGEAEPHWSVVTRDEYRADRIAETETDFYRSGERSLSYMLAALARCGIAPGRIGHATDFGCGVGRVSAAMVRQGWRVTAADISPGHLAVAARHFSKAGLDQAETTRLDALEAIDALPETDLFYSLIVLQHDPPPLIAETLRRALARVRPGGLAYFQVPVYREGYVYDLAADLAREERSMEMHVLPAPHVFRILDEAGFRPLEVTSDCSLEELSYESQVFLAERRPASTEPRGGVDG